MDADILLKMNEDYENVCVTTPMCIYASYLKSDDLSIWFNNKYLGISDNSDYLKECEKALEEGEEVSLIYETTDVNEVKRIKKALGRADYSKRLLELHSIVTKEKGLSLTKK